MLFNLLAKKDINSGVEEYHSTPGAILLDVRTREEYNEYHIPDSLNIPLQNIAEVTRRIPANNTPIFVHCLSGGRSGQAVSFLKNSGYKNVTNIGGINAYRGRTV